jgi:hypothetical protein
MLQLLRSQTTGLFLNETAEWTSLPRQARSFANHDQAIAARQALGLPETELYYCFQDDGVPQWDFAVSLSFYDGGPGNPWR